MTAIDPLALAGSGGEGLGLPPGLATTPGASEKTGLTSLLLHYPPYYGHEKGLPSLRLFADRVIPEFRPS